MHGLLERYFSGVDRPTFERDLGAKDAVVLLEQEDGGLAGFTTFVVTLEHYLGQDLRVVFSGDTIVAEGHRNSTALITTWGRHMLDLAETEPSVPLYWFLISMGYKTYRYLPLFLQDFYPSPRGTRDASLRPLLHHLVNARFGEGFDPERELITTWRDRTFLRSEAATVPPGREQEEEVAFFLSRNPGYDRGDELPCLGRLEVANFTPLVRRILKV
ncbi:MAG: hypothetical protein A2284_09475 [Deltaproteobacteria bacterium RIFOXYA12_FULL_61_11]|nr:MAG: hypothetical protein A2284_09475 [Deltaproteobacteria bacterium RIFOXYA12_FULL_61_11]